MKLVSAIIPTRKRLMRLIKTVDSIFSTAATPSRVEVVIKADEDDYETIQGFPTNKYPDVKIVIGPRYSGYGSIGKFVTEAEESATGKWSFFIDDDCWIEGQGWDNLLDQIAAEKTVASCQIYHLGPNRYCEGCGIIGLFWPHHAWKQFGHSEIGSPADQWLHDVLVTQNGFKMNIMQGITYRHDRDNEDVLAAHHLL